MRAARLRWLLPAAFAALLPVAAVALDEQQQRGRILAQTQEMEDQIEHAGSLVGDAALDAYLQAVTDRLFPERASGLRVRAYRSAEFNAFAVATGSLYINTGALLRLENESQLAAILGHEGGHVAADHVYRFISSAKRTSVVSVILSAAITAAIGFDPLLGQMVGLSSMAGFSRENEREADRMGFDRMVAAGYDPAAGEAVFGRLARELQVRKVQQGPYFFSSHPKVTERAASYHEFAAAVPAVAPEDPAPFLAATNPVRMAALADIHTRADGPLLVFLLEDERLLGSLPPEARFYLGEGYRLRNGEGDRDRAVAAWRETVTTAPGFGPAYGALGFAALRAGDKPQALEMLARFVEFSPGSRQAAYARQQITRLQAELAPAEAAPPEGPPPEPSPPAPTLPESPP
jgi:predicted Zn-dependent protease